MEDIFSRFLRRPTASKDTGRPKGRGNGKDEEGRDEPIVGFSNAWEDIKEVLEHPDERALSRGIQSTIVPRRIQYMIDTLVSESNQTDDQTTGACLEYLLKHDVLSTLERLAGADEPEGIKAEVLVGFNLLVALLDENFLVHNAVHRPLRRLLRSCVGDEPEEIHLDNQARPMGAAASGSAQKGSLVNYEKDLLELMCMLCKRIRSYPALLMIFFHDKSLNTYRPPTVTQTPPIEQPEDLPFRTVSASPSNTLTAHSTDRSSSVSQSTEQKKEPEFLLFAYLLRFIHRESPIGEFARAGLMFLLDIAFSPSSSLSPPPPPPSSSSLSSSSFSPTTTTATTTPPSGPSHPTEGQVSPSDLSEDIKCSMAEYMLQGDFPEVLGAGLGAVYSLLPNKLAIRPELRSDASNGTGGGMILGRSTEDREFDEDEDDDETGGRQGGRSIMAIEGEDSTSPEFKDRLDLFLKSCEFISDVINRASSLASVQTSSSPSSSSSSSSSDLPSAAAEIDSPTTTTTVPQAATLVDYGSALSRAILRAVRSTFLEHVLYPSILECSDQDGSAVAVIAYIDIILSTLDRESALCQMFLGFLMGEDEDGRSGWTGKLGSDIGFIPRSMGGTKQDRTEPATTKLDRRKSSAMILLENMQAPRSTGSQHYFTSQGQGRFTLKDLIVDNITSSNPPTASATLRLLNTILTRYPNAALHGLLDVLPDYRSTVVPFSLPSLSFDIDDDDVGVDADTDATVDAAAEDLFDGDDGDGSRKIDLDPSQFNLAMNDVFGHPGISSSDPEPSGTQPDVNPSGSLLDWHAPKRLMTAAFDHTREVELYLSLVADIDHSHHSAHTPVPSRYENYLQDAMLAIESDRSLTNFQLGLLSFSKEQDVLPISSPLSPRSRPRSSSEDVLALARNSKLNPSDPLLQLVLDRLREFFIHTPEENLALTGVLASIGLNTNLCLEGWLVFPSEDEIDSWAALDRKMKKKTEQAGSKPARTRQNIGDDDDEAEEEEEEEEEKNDDAEDEKDDSTTKSKTVVQSDITNDPFIKSDPADTQPILYVLFKDLVRKLERYRLMEPQFDVYLSERRQGLFFEETMSDILMDVSEPSWFTTTAAAATMTTTTTTTTNDFLSPSRPIPFTRPQAQPGPISSPRTGGGRTLATPRSNVSSPATPQAKKTGWSLFSPLKRTPVQTPPAVFESPKQFPYVPRVMFGGASPRTNKSGPSTPYADHYSATIGRKVESLVADSPRKGAWSPARVKHPRPFDPAKRQVGGISMNDMKDDCTTDEDEEVGHEEIKDRPPAGEQRVNQTAQVTTTQVSLSQVLDNVVILEECLKELVAIRVARLSQGADTLVRA